MRESDCDGQDFQQRFHQCCDFRRQCAVGARATDRQDHSRHQNRQASLAFTDLLRNVVECKGPEPVACILWLQPSLMNGGAFKASRRYIGSCLDAALETGLQDANQAITSQYDMRLGSHDQ